MGPQSDISLKVKDIVDLIEKEVVDVDEEEDIDEIQSPPPPPTLSRTELLDLFHQAVPSLLHYGKLFTQNVYKYCAILRREQLATCTQTTLDAFLGI
ncbi:hypothetical protein M378DRAFT_172110 [Amanita muscaria Koide BX008]|uniref:Uncharacterized protein n=1 Tax=Amanita muscaria (strain Koide BX008) TaxID=946122 RepID=A0A0C2S392_AMAMK|nr:hypothetical protein M378DRAFT_172110 [Amanita muscaria Koide BX008]